MTLRYSTPLLATTAVMITSFTAIDAFAQENCRWLGLPAVKVCDGQSPSPSRNPRPGFFCIGPNGLTSDPNACINPLEATDEQVEQAIGRPVNRTLSPQEEAAVEERLAERTLPQRTQQLLSAIEHSIEIATGLTESTVFELRGNDQEQLDEAIKWMSRTEAELAGGVSNNRLDELRAESLETLTTLNRLVRQAQTIDQETRSIDNIVLDIQDLVARVGTVLRSLQLESVVVPSKVTRRYEQAKAIVRDSKASCSARRPEGCGVLIEVLDLIDEVREPLCALQSDVLSFCRG